MNISIKTDDDTETGSNPRNVNAKTIKRNPSAKKNKNTERITQQKPTTIVGFKPVSTEVKVQKKPTGQTVPIAKPAVSFNLQEQDVLKPVKANYNLPGEEEPKKKNFIELNKMRVRTQSQNSGKGVDYDNSFSCRLLNTIKSKIGDVSKCLTKSIRSQSAMTTAQGVSRQNNADDVAAKRKLIASQSEVELKVHNAKSSDRAKENEKASVSLKTFLYEPPMNNAKVIRAWEIETGRKYYDLSPSSRR